MELNIKFANNTPEVDFKQEFNELVPIELKIAGNLTGFNPTETMEMYRRNVDYLLRGVANYASGDIKQTSLIKEPFGSIIKDMDSVHWNFKIPKTSFIIYSIDDRGIEEHMYVAEGIAVAKEDHQPTGIYALDNAEEFSTITPIWLHENLKTDSLSLKENITTAIMKSAEYLDDYFIAYGAGGKKGLSILNKDMQEIDVEEIKDNGVYFFIRFIQAVLNKGINHGVVLLDCKNLSDKMIMLYRDVLTGLYGDTFFFIYNVPSNSEVNRVTINLPEFRKRK